MSNESHEALWDEEARLSILYRYQVLETPREEDFDDIVALVAQVLEAPIAAINLIDRHRQWFKAEIGLGVREMPLDDSICKSALLQSDGMVILDLMEDERFSCNPLVSGGPNLRFYAGELLKTSQGLPLGTLCVLDTKPRSEGLTNQQRFALKALAKQVMGQLELRLALYEQAVLIEQQKATQLALAVKERTATEAMSVVRGAERALKESEAKFRIMTNVMPQMVWATQPGEETDYFNDRILEFTGQPKEVLTGPGWANCIHPDDLPKAYSEWQHALATGTSLESEYRLRHHSGEYRWVLGRALPLQREDGTSHWMGTFTDIQDQKTAAEQLQLANERKDEFLAMLAHELRNPLAPVANAVQLLRLRAGNESRVQEITNVIERQVKHMTELVNDLLDVSRISQGLAELHKAAVDMKVVVALAIEQVRPLIEAKGHTLHTTISAEHATVIGDKRRLIQTLSNILTNAAKYTPNSGHIKLAFDVSANEVKISVYDDGAGIEASLLPYVFDLFTQAQRTPDRAQGGLGLGLTLVKRIIELHSGIVAAESAGRGQGSMFSVLLPLAPEEDLPSKMPKRNEVKNVSSNNRRILLVDDNEDAARSLAMLLEGCGHEVVIEIDGLRGLETALTHSPEVIILDIGLPDINGYELARRLRAEDETRNIVLLAITGYGQEQDKELAKAAGFDYHLVKPVDFQELKNLIEGLS